MIHNSMFIKQNTQILHKWVHFKYIFHIFLWLSLQITGKLLEYTILYFQT